jgi:type I restriction enzyme M protein
VGQYLQRALDEGKATLGAAGARQTITYVAVNHTESIAIEVPVPDRVPGDFADLVVCRDDARTDPYVVIECKADGISTTDFEQAVEQAVGNGSGHKFRADYVAVAAGMMRRVLDISKRFGVLERVKNQVADLPEAYHDPAAFRYVKCADPADPAEIKAATKDELITILRRCHDTLWEAGKRTPPQAFSDLSKLLFLKIADEKRPRTVGMPYEVQIKSGETAADLGRRMRRLYDDHRRSDRDIFTDDLGIPDEKLRTVVGHLQGTNISASDIDAKGVAFELFMGSYFKGDFGQYFTPREIVAFAVDMLDVAPDEWLIDPACGSGGFLLRALEVVRGKADDPQLMVGGPAERYQLWNEFATKRLFGIELNSEIARICKMNMILHGDGHTNIVANDALVDPTALAGLNRGIQMGQFDVLITNVPFGGKLNLAAHPYISTYPALGNTYAETKTKGRVKRPRKTQKSEILFLERIWQFLRPGGRCAVIVPDGILTNAQTGYVRDFLDDHFQTLAIVSLPIETFTHYEANVKASILFMRKFEDGETFDAERPTFLAEAEGVGYDATGRPAPNHLPAIHAAYIEFCEAPARDLVDVPDLGAPADEAADDDDE